MDKQYKNINTIVDELLGVFSVVVPMFILGSATFVFKDEILNQLVLFSSDIIEYSF